MQNAMTPKSALGRPLDPSYPTNLAILIVVPIIGIAIGVFRLITTGDLGFAFTSGLVVGASTFTAWVLSRELDPDHDLSAFVAVAFAAIAYLIFQPTTIALLSLGLLITGSRIVNRIVGLPPKVPPESVVVFILIVVAAYVEGWFIALVGAVLFLFDAVLQPPERRHFFFAIASLVAGVLILLLTSPAGPAPVTQYIAPIAVISVVFLITIALTNHINSRTDLTNEPVSANRIRAVMILALLGGGLLVWWHGDYGVLATLPLWASLLAIPIYRVIALIRPGK